MYSQYNLGTTEHTRMPEWDVKETFIIWVYYDRAGQKLASILFKCCNDANIDEELITSLRTVYDGHSKV